MSAFNDIGQYVRTGGHWFPGEQIHADRGGYFVIRFQDAREFSSWQGEGEVERAWRGTRGKGWIKLDPRVVDEAVDVARHGRYRGLPVRQFGHVVDGHVVVCPEDPHPRTGEDLGFTGDPRFGREKEIAVEEFVDVIEEVQVLYRREQGWLRG